MTGFGVDNKVYEGISLSGGIRILAPSDLSVADHVEGVRLDVCCV